jgi:metal-responsive CopG/Arc/MetJ family transcriptional regulator
MTTKRRLSASVDEDLIRAAEAAAARGEVSTVSAWVNEALRQKLDHERRLHALASFVATFEAEHGEISDAEMEHAARQARGRAVTVRTVKPARLARPKRRAG